MDKEKIIDGIDVSKCEDNKNGYCIGINECSSRCFKKILDIITKIKENN